MRLVHPSRSIIILFIILVVITFLIGSLHAFGIAHAASSVMPMPTPNPVSLPGTDLEPTPVPTPAEIPGDTTGIIALAIIIVMIVVIDAILGNGRNKIRISLKKKS